MRKVLSALVLVIIIAFFHGCTKESSLDIPDDFEGILSVRKWEIIGPFEFDTLAQNPLYTFKNKDLDKYGIDEEHFVEIDSTIIRNHKINHFQVQCYDSPVKLLDYVDRKQLTNKSNIYLYTSIHSGSEKEVVFIFDGSRNYKVWINQKQVLEVLNKENTIKNGDRFVRITLQKGNNLVFAKVNRGTNQYSWGILMVISSDKAAKKVYKDNYLKDFINNPIVSDSLSLYLGPFEKAAIRVIDRDNNVGLNEFCVNKLQENIILKCNNIGNGFNTAKLFVENDTLQEYIFKGDIFAFTEKLISEARHLKCDNARRSDLNAAIDRLKFLIKKYDNSSEAAVRYYHRNLLYYAKNLYDLIQFIKNNEIYRGTFIKAYHTNEKNKVYHYMMHIDRRLLSKTSPLSIILFAPYELVDTTLPGSWYIGNLDQIEMDSKMADEYSFALVWLFLRGCNYTPRSAVEDFKSVIKSVKKDYYLDTTGIYLTGECIGGRRALLLAEKCPDYFGGISVRSPETKSSTEMESPINFVGNLRGIPICIFHGIDDNEVPIERTRIFASKAQEYGIFIKVVETQTGHLSLSRDERRNVFLFFDSLKTHRKIKMVNDASNTISDQNSYPSY